MVSYQPQTAEVMAARLEDSMDRVGLTTSRQRLREAHYRIRLAGRVDDLWADRFAGMEVVGEEIAPNGAVVTTLAGCMPDQAALTGVLNMAYDLGLDILAVERDEDGCAG